MGDGQVGTPTHLLLHAYNVQMSRSLRELPENKKYAPHYFYPAREQRGFFKGDRPINNGSNVFLTATLTDAEGDELLEKDIVAQDLRFPFLFIVKVDGKETERHDGPTAPGQYDQTNGFNLRLHVGTEGEYEVSVETVKGPKLSDTIKFRVA